VSRAYGTQPTMLTRMMRLVMEDMVEFLRHPASIVGSDGVAMAWDALSERPHPRFYGTFPRVLGRYVREKGALHLEDAVRKMSGEPADRFHISRRGYLKAGYAADLVLFSAGAVAGTATFAKPNRLPVGIAKVYVNGHLVVDQGTWHMEQYERRPRPAPWRRLSRYRRSG
jgi:N-acyl-D-aspartate/D-glutamate deacylase